MRDTHEHQNDPTFQDAMKAFNNKASCFETEFHEIQYCQICNEHIEQGTKVCGWKKKMLEYFDIPKLDEKTFLFRRHVE